MEVIADNTMILKNQDQSYAITRLEELFNDKNNHFINFKLNQIFKLFNLICDDKFKYEYVFKICNYICLNLESIKTHYNNDFSYKNFIFKIMLKIHQIMMLNEYNYMLFHSFYSKFYHEYYFQKINITNNL